MKKRNIKGFTLVELLAVIVILAILMVSAGAGVMSTMNNSKINSFKNEILTAINSAEDMYSEISMSTTDYGTFVASNIAGPDGGGTHSGLCVTFSGLVNNGYLNKDVTTYGGLVLVEVPYDGGATKYMVWAHNSTYGIPGIEKNNINKLKFNKKNNVSTGATGNTSAVGGKMPTTMTSAASTSTAIARNASTGLVGVVTNLNGIKSLLRTAYGNDNAMGTVTKSTATTATGTAAAQINAKEILLYSPNGNRGGTANTYRLKCINVKLD